MSKIRISNKQFFRINYFSEKNFFLFFMVKKLCFYGGIQLLLLYLGWRSGPSKCELMHYANRGEGFVSMRMFTHIFFNFVSSP